MCDRPPPGGLIKKYFSKMNMFSQHIIHGVRKRGRMVTLLNQGQINNFFEWWMKRRNFECEDFLYSPHLSKWKYLVFMHPLSEKLATLMSCVIDNILSNIMDYINSLTLPLMYKMPYIIGYIFSYIMDHMQSQF